MGSLVAGSLSKSLMNTKEDEAPYSAVWMQTRSPRQSIWMEPQQLSPDNPGVLVPLRCVTRLDDILSSSASYSSASSFGHRFIYLVCLKGLQATARASANIKHFIHSLDSSAAASSSSPSSSYHLIVSLMNGLGHEDILREGLGLNHHDSSANGLLNPNRVKMLVGITTQGATLNEDRLRYTSAGHTTIISDVDDDDALSISQASKLSGLGQVDPARITTSCTLGAEDVVQALRFAGFSVSQAPASQKQAILWSKLLVNAAINPLTALYDVKNGELLLIPQAMEEMHHVINEVLDVAIALGIDLLPSLRPVSTYSQSSNSSSVSDADAWSRDLDQLRNAAMAHVQRVLHQTSGNVSSMLADVRRHGRAVELDCIMGAVVTAAAKCGVRVPTCQRLMHRVQQLHTSRSPSISL